MSNRVRKHQLLKLFCFDICCLFIKGQSQLCRMEFSPNLSFSIKKKRFESRYWCVGMIWVLKSHTAEKWTSGLRVMPCDTPHSGCDSSARVKRRCYLGPVAQPVPLGRTVQVDRLDRTIMRKKGRKWQGAAPPAVDTHAPLWVRVLSVYPTDHISAVF